MGKPPMRPKLPEVYTGASRQTAMVTALFTLPRHVLTRKSSKKVGCTKLCYGIYFYIADVAAHLGSVNPCLNR